MRRTAKHAIAVLCLSLTVVIASGRIGQAQTYVATTGIVDSDSLLTYEFKDAFAFVRGNWPAKVTLRFNILPVGDLLVPVTEACCEGRALWVRFLDNGDGARVLVNLKGLNILNGEITTLLTFDSNDYPAQPEFQISTPYIGLSKLVNFSFATGPFGVNQAGGSVYWLEAELIRSERGGTPGLASISIIRTLAP